MLDFKLIKTPEDFELFCEELLKSYGFTIVSRNARGPGQGKDIVCFRYYYDEFIGYHIQNFLVECKHFAFSGKSVYESDIKEFFQRTINHECNHYLLITTTVASVTVRDQIEGANKNKSLPITAAIWNRSDLVKRIYEQPKAWEFFTDQTISPLSGLKCFQGFDDFLSFGSHYTPDKRDFINDLFYVSKNDGQIIDNIIRIFESKDNSSRIALLEGPPASGKSILSLLIAKGLEDEGYSTFFHRVTSKSSIDNIWQDLIQNNRPKTLFVFENCHLNTEIANFIYANISLVNNLSFLFVTRIISQKVRFSSELDNLDVFESLAEVTFRLNPESNNYEKVIGIVEKYKRHYESVYNKPFLIGDITKILENIKGNLLALHYYLEFWPTINSLDAADRKLVSKEIYKRYLMHPASAILLKYAAIYQFEINIEPQEQEVLSADLLLSQGVLLYDFEKETYNFYHSDFSKLLIESYQSRPSFNRKYEDIEDFIFIQLKDYLKGFIKYPSNVHELIFNLFSSNNPSIFKKLLSDSQIKEIFLKYYSENKNAHHISEFLYCVFVTKKELVEEFGKNLIMNEYAKSIFVKRNIFPFATILQLLYNANENFYEAFLNLFSDNDLSEMILSSPLSSVTSALRSLKRHYSLKSKLEKYITLNYIILESKKIGFRAISMHFAFLSKFNSELIFEALSSLSTEYLTTLAEIEVFSNMATGIVTFHNIDAKKAKEIYLNIPENILLSKAQEPGVSFIGLTNGLLHLSKIDFKKTRRLTGKIDFQLFLEKAQDSSNNFSKLIAGLTVLNKLSYNKSQLILSKVDIEKLFKSAMKENIFLIFQGLNQLNQINFQIARSLISKIDIRPVVDSITLDVFSINSFSKLLSDFHNADMEKAWSILDNVKEHFLFNRLLEDTISLAELGQTLSIFKKIHPSKAYSIFYKFTLADLVNKAKNGKFTGVALGMSALSKLNRDKINNLLYDLSISFFVKKAEEKQVNFGALVKGLSFLKSINIDFTKEIYSAINTDIIREKYLKAKRNKYITKNKEILFNLDRDKTAHIFNGI